MTAGRRRWPRSGGQRRLVIFLLPLTDMRSLSVPQTHTHTYTPFLPEQKPSYFQKKKKDIWILIFSKSIWRVWPGKRGDEHKDVKDKQSSLRVTWRKLNVNIIIISAAVALYQAALHGASPPPLRHLLMNCQQTPFAIFRHGADFFHFHN